MTDLEINIALAKACGYVCKIPQGLYPSAHGECHPFEGALYCNHYDWVRKFDYRDPVIFVAICKHWKLSVFHRKFLCYCQPALKDFFADTIEKAAALCVIDAVKRGVK